MTIGELAQRLKTFLELEGCRIDSDAPECPHFAIRHPGTGLSFVFNLPGDPDDGLGDQGVEAHVVLPLLEWAQLKPGAEAEIKDLLACQDTLPGSSNSLGYVRGANGKPCRITLQGSAGLQDMSVEDEQDIRLLLESLALDSLDAIAPLRPYLQEEQACSVS